MASKTTWKYLMANFKSAETFIGAYSKLARNEKRVNEQRKQGHWAGAGGGGIEMFESPFAHHGVGF